MEKFAVAACMATVGIPMPLLNGTASLREDRAISPFSWAMSGVDTDHDGCDEIVVGGGGAIWIFSGKAGKLMARIEGTHAVWVPALDGKPGSNLLVASAGVGFQMHSGADFSIVPGSKYEVPKSTQITCLIRVPDIDGDGNEEVLFGSNAYSALGLPGCGALWIVSTQTGKIVRAFCGSVPEERLGCAAFSGSSRAGGIVQIVASSSTHLESWSIRDGEIADHHSLALSKWGCEGQAFGIGPAGDVDGDGWLDLIIPGLVGIDTEQFGGCLRIVSTKNGAELFAMQTKLRIQDCGMKIMETPWRALAAMDADADREGEIFVGCESVCRTLTGDQVACPRNQVTVLSSSGNHGIREIPAAKFLVFDWNEALDVNLRDDCWEIPWALTNLGDIDHDGRSDLLVIPHVGFMEQAFVLSGADDHRIVSIQLRE